MNCNQCIHISICNAHGYIDADDCHDFKNKSDYAEVVHGEWIWTETGDEDYEQYWICSVCGEKDYIKSKYCPECGAKMRGDTE